MEFICFSEEEKKNRRSELLEMTAESDREFVPPLSLRTSTVQGCLNGSKETSGEETRAFEEVKAGVLPYFEEMMAQEIIAAVENGLSMDTEQLLKEALKKLSFL